MISSFYKSINRDFTLLEGDCIKLLPQFNFKFDMIFADPPYFLSNDGISVQSGKIVSVNKGDWDKGGTIETINEFNLQWIKLCHEKLKDNGTIWVSGTYHNIFSVANALQQCGFRILNVITWAKTNPPPNISCRFKADDGRVAITSYCQLGEILWKTSYTKAIESVGENYSCINRT